MTGPRSTAIAFAALTGVALCAIPLESASAFTLNSPSGRSASADVSTVQWRHHGGWHHGGWGPGAVIGGLAAGALLGGGLYGYYGPRYDYDYGPYSNCWRDGWGRLRCY
jgi:hypothetical protein